jgi:hypothetical protein
VADENWVCVGWVILEKIKKIRKIDRGRQRTQGEPFTTHQNLFRVALPTAARKTKSALAPLLNRAATQIAAGAARRS